MRDLLIFELKKIIKKKLNIVVLLGGLILAAILFTLPVVQFVSFDKDGNQIRGKSAINIEKQRQNEMSGTLTDERIKKDILSYQNLFNDDSNVIISEGKKELSESAFSNYIAPRMYYLGLLNNNYTDPNVYDYSFLAIKNLLLDNTFNFYKQKDNKINQLLSASYRDWNYSNQEKIFWTEKSENVPTPYEYGYHEGWKTVLNCIELMALFIVIICICIAPIFSGEYQSGADNIILSSKYGKSKLISAKILAAFIFSTIAYTVYITLAMGIILLSFGMDGWNLPIQIINSIVPYSLTFLSATSLCIITLYIVMFAMVCVTLTLSAKMKTEFSVLICIICIIMIPFFFKISETSGLWNHIYMILPSTACLPVFNLDATNYFSYPLPGFTLDILTMRIVFYLIISLICIPLIYRIFKKHQVI